MSANAPWSVKGIDPQAREIAKDLARRSGQTLGEWINSMIIEGGKGEAPKEALEPEPICPVARHPYREERSPARDNHQPAYSEARGAFHGAYPEPEYEPDYAEDRYPEPRTRRATASRYPEPAARPSGRSRFDFDDLGTDELTRIARAVERLGARVEQSDQRATLAVNAVDQSVAGVLSRLELIERDQMATVSRVESVLEDRLRRLEEDDTGSRQEEAVRGLENALGKIAVQLFEGEQRNAGAFADLRGGLASVERRVERAEQRQTASPLPAPRPAVEPGVMVEQVVARVAERLSQAENKTSAALHTLEGSFAALDRRLHAAEGQLDPRVAAELEQRVGVKFEHLAAELTGQIEAARLEMAGRLTEIADNRRLEELEAPLRELQRHAEAAERRQSDAIKRLGREVMRVTEALNARVARVEVQTGETVQRLAEALNVRVVDLETQLHAQTGEALAVAARVDEAVARTHEAVQRSNETLGGRLATVEVQLGEGLARTAELFNAKVAGVQARSGEAIAAASEQLQAQLAQAEARVAAQAEETVERVSEILSARTDEVEAHTSKAIERVVGIVEQRLLRSDETQADAFERLGGEMARVSERLADRIDTAERRSAEAIEEVGDKVAEVSERLNARYERAAAGLAERMRESEERLARVLEETRERLDARLAEARRGLLDTLGDRVVESETGLDDRFDRRVEETGRGLFDRPRQELGQIASRETDPTDGASSRPGDLAADPGENPAPVFGLDVAPETAADSGDQPSDDPDGALAPFSAFASADGFRHAPLDLDDPFVPPAVGSTPVVTVIAEAPALEEPADYATPSASAHPVSEDGYGTDFHVGDEFVTVAKTAAAPPAPAAAPVEEWSFDVEPLELATPAGEAIAARLTPEPAVALWPTRRTLEEARAAAPAASAGGKRPRKTRLTPIELGPPPPMTGLGGSRLRPPSVGGLMAKLGRKKDEKDGANVRTTALVAGVSFAVSAIAGGAYFLNRDAPDAARPDADRAGAPIAASLVVPAATLPAAPSPENAQLYAAAVQALRAGQSEQGLADLRRAAEGGHAPAQLYLADLYTEGRGGVSRDPAQAREWTARAAQLGNRTAMHNLAMAFMEGEGGPTDYASAAR